MSGGTAAGLAAMLLVACSAGYLAGDHVARRVRSLVDRRRGR